MVDAATVRDLKKHQAVVLPLISEFGDRINDTACDGILAEFPSAVAAVECAMEIQKIMAARNRGKIAAGRMQFRNGINLGDVIRDETRIYGDGINVAARLENLAEPGGICISEDVHRKVRDKRRSPSSERQYRKRSLVDSLARGSNSSIRSARVASREIVSVCPLAEDSVRHAQRWASDTLRRPAVAAGVFRDGRPWSIPFFGGCHA